MLVVILIILGAGFFLFTRSNNSIPKESVVIKGSDTEVQLVSNLVEVFLQSHMNADVSVTGGGSGTGIAALLNGEIDIANSSRAMSEEELAQAKNAGLDVQEFILARDGLSVIVHPDNLVTALTVDEVGKIYKGEITDWKEVHGKPGPIVMYGRQSTSGTYVFFRDTVVKDDYAPSMLNMEGNAAIADAIARDTQGIGYIGVGYAKDETGKVRDGISIMLIKKDSSSEGVSPLDKEKVLSGAYPIVRPIYQYLKELPAPGSAVDTLLRFEAGLEGQAVLNETGFYSPIQADTAQNQILFDSIK